MRISDWSSDVCSSDLPAAGVGYRHVRDAGPVRHAQLVAAAGDRDVGRPVDAAEPGRLGGAGLCRGLPVLHLAAQLPARGRPRSEEHTSELQSLMRISYAVFCLKQKKINTHTKSKDT